jgi:predicted TPR repeat methyltransferase
MLGLLACQVDRRDLGIPLIERAIARDGTVAAFRVNLGNALLADGRTEAGAAAFRDALALDPDCVDALANLATIVKRTDWDAALGLYERALARDPDHAESHFGLAGVLRRLERFDEAERHYRRALELRPSLTPVHRELARFLYMRRRFDEAAAVYREWLRVRPGDPVATHNLAAITGQDIPRASDAFVRQLFDAFAPSFDDDLANLEYRAPELVGAALRELRGAPEADLDVLDAGCGTGLCGIELRPYARSLTGVDLSEKMLARARERELYDELVAGELTAFLVGSPPARYDLIALSDTLVYFGALEAVFAGAADTLKPGGHFLFTVERLAGTDGDHRIMPYGRYRHGAAYLERALGEAGFRCRIVREVVLRKEAGEDVDGLLVAAERKAR